MNTHPKYLIAFLFSWLALLPCGHTQNDVTLTSVPESAVGAMDGKLTVSVDNVGTGTGQYPPPFTFRLEAMGSGNSPVEFINATGTAVFTDLSYRYYCLTVVMGNGCSAHACFYFDEACASGCLAADFNYEYDSYACMVNFEDWTEGVATNQNWDFGDGTTSTGTNPSHIYSESGCYNVVLTVSNATQTRTVIKQVCITGCPQGNNLYPTCHITGPTVAAKGQTINLSGVVSGLAPFTYSWQTPAFINASPSSILPDISVTIPTNANNDQQYDFFFNATDSHGNSTQCVHEVTVRGNIPDIEALVFGSFEANKPLDLMAFVDVFNLTGPEQYYFVIKKGSQVHYDATMCLNKWQYAYDCTLPGGLEEGFYTLYVDVQDAAGTYSAQKDFTIGSPTPVPDNPPMSLEIKYPTTPEIAPGTQHYVLNWGSTMSIGINGQHPHPGFWDCLNPTPCNLPCITHTPQKEYYVVLHFKNLTTGQTFNYGDPYTGDLAGLLSTYPKSLNWEFFVSAECSKGTLMVTGEVYSVPCESNPFPINFTGINADVLYTILKPLYIDLHPKPPQIAGLAVNYGWCTQPITVLMASNCTIQSYEWHAYDPFTHQEIADFFPSNANTATVLPNLNNAFFDRFESGEIPKIHCKVTVVDVNGFTAEYTALLNISVPLRINLPNMLFRCPGAISTFSEESVATGGRGTYTFRWSPSSLTGDNPVFTTPTGGDPTNYSVTVTDQAGCSANKTFSVSVSTLALNLYPYIYACVDENCSRPINPTDVGATGGSGHYIFTWSAVNTNHLAYLSSTDVFNPTVKEIPVGQTITYTLQVQDALGGCTATDSKDVTGYANDMTVNVTGPGSVCYGLETSLTADGNPVGTGWGNIFYYYTWTTNNPHYPNIQNQHSKILPISALTNSYPGTYTYTVRYNHLFTGCYAEKDIQLTVKPNWKYVGYVPKIAYAVEGSIVDIWQPYSDNRIIYPNPYSSATNFLKQWIPFQPITVINNGGSTPLVPKNGTFMPTTAQPYLTLKVSESGCSKSFKSIHYIMTSKQPEVWVVPDKSSICVGDGLCFNVVFDMHVADYQTALLPPTITAHYVFKPPYPAQIPQDPVYGTIELQLVNTSGLYKGKICKTGYFIQQSSSASQHPYLFAIETLNSSVVPVSWYDVNYDNASIWIDVLDNMQRPSLQTCIIQEGAFYQLTLGLLPCTNNNTTISSGYEKHIIAGDFIEIKPDAAIELYATNPGMGQHLFVSKCISQQAIAKDDDPDNEVTGRNADSIVQGNFALQLEVVPNPFTGLVTIRYTLPLGQPDEVSLDLLDFTGRLVQHIRPTNDHQPGYHEIEFDGSTLTPGIYLYRLVVGNKGRIIKKVVKVGF